MDLTKHVSAAALILAALAGGADADLPTGQAGMVVARWGAYRHTQHKAVTFTPGAQGTTMTVDLSAVPKQAAVGRARLVFLAGQGFEVLAGGKPLRLVEPYNLWFDATEAIRAAVAAGQTQAALTIRGGGRIKPQDVFLEIAYAGILADKPLAGLPPGRQVAGLKAFHRHGQTFLTWTEIEDLAEGKADIAWGEMVKKVRDCNPMVGIIPKWPDREIRYSVYRHTAPITAANIAQAQFIHDVAQGSVYVEDAIARGRQGEQGPTFLIGGQVLRRVMLEKGKFLPPGTGFHWTTTAKAGKAYYAVVTAVNGVENTADFSDANTAGPFDEKVAPPAPMLVAEQVTPLRRPEGAEWREQWYSWWCVPPLSVYPRRYDVCVAYCPQTREKSAALSITRGAWDYPIRMPGAEARNDVVLAHTMDVPIAFRMGPCDAQYNLKSPQQAQWRPWPMRRQEALVGWAQEQFGVDPQRVTVGMGAWGMMEIERPDLYAMIHGYGQPEVTKGFQCWNRACGVWGRPEVYAGRNDQENPFVRSDYSRYVLADPAKETPFFMMYAIRSAHLAEMGWPALPRYLRAMIDARRPFVLHWRVRKPPAFRRDQSVPAFGHCTLDDNPGNGDLRNGITFDAQINGYLSWDPATIVDAPDRWEMTVILDGLAPLDTCLVDLTPRKCQAFKAKAGEKFTWTCTAPGAPPKKTDTPAPGKVLGRGTVVADKHGLVTVKQMALAKGSQRVVISK